MWFFSVVFFIYRELWQGNYPWIVFIQNRSQLDLLILQTSLLSHWSLPPILVDTISREVTRNENVLLTIYVGFHIVPRSVIIIIYFPWNVISKQYFSWIVMRPISPTQRCVSGNVYKQTSLEITEVSCTRRTIMSFLHETSLIWDYQPGGEIMTSLLPVVTQCKDYHINVKYMINVDIAIGYLIIKRGGLGPLIGLSLPHLCACPKPGPGFPMLHVVVFLCVQWF